jgi:hypothetical protein
MLLLKENPRNNLILFIDTAFDTGPDIQYHLRRLGEGFGSQYIWEGIARWAHYYLPAWTVVADHTMALTGKTVLSRTGKEMLKELWRGRWIPHRDRDHQCKAQYVLWHQSLRTMDWVMHTGLGVQHWPRHHAPYLEEEEEEEADAKDWSFKIHTVRIA